MNENIRTTVFVLVAVVVALAVFAISSLKRPGTWFGDGGSLDDLKGEMLFADFKDPLAATSLEVVRYNEETGDQTDFKVAQVDGMWSIPSHANYPADAKDHLAAAAADLIDLKILGVAGDNPADHGLYGVIDPTGKGLKPGTPGVGMKIIMKGNKDKTLVSMIVGKEDPESPGLRYVRRAGQDVVLIVKLSTDKLTTDFGDWIEKDLLKLNPWDLKEIFVQEYSVDELLGGVPKRGEFTLAYDDSAEQKWKLLADRQTDRRGQWVDVKLGPDEELNTQKLDAMQNALDDLKIVDVARKPPELTKALASSTISPAERRALQLLLAPYGFYLPEDPSGKVTVYSNEGEIRVLMKNGVEYVLRFGAIAGSSAASAGESEEDKQADSEGVNRFLLVTAEFNPAPIPKPQLEPLPSEEPKKDDAGDKPKEEKAKEATDEKTKQPDAGKKPKDEKKADLQKERQRIEKENKRKQEEYDEKIAEGEKKVAELNTRFADWYYVISESVYKKIHLGRGDIIKRKEKEGGTPKAGQAKPLNPLDALTPDAFNQLRQGPE